MKNDIQYSVKEKISLLEFLQIKNSGQSKKKIKSYLSHKMIYVNGILASSLEQVLLPKQVVSLKLSQIRSGFSDSRLVILYEDKDILVVTKPSGLLSIATEGEKEETMYHLASQYVKSENPKNKIFILHRLDRDTSGVIMFAKHENIRNLFQNSWDTLVKTRGYIAVVEGVLEQDTGVIESYLKENEKHFVYSTKDKNNGKLAITEYKVLKRGSYYTWVDVCLKTGRKNQIRVHFSDLHHPIVGDKKYKSTCNPFKRLGLHAHLLEVEHPITHRLYSFKAPIPKIFHV